MISQQLPLYILVPVLLGIVSIVGLFFSIKQDTYEMKKHMQTDWTQAHMRIWVSELKYLNTNCFKVPSVNETVENERDHNN